ncbi:hypothetical protein ADN00_06830 [Ornatilinea apprima]|uniref:Glycosyltransferase RgtA/B/C/D-like domain-containing protein n=1 Tax=Ornatilinea apprima TaxID=1134406 RepID=A0A0P6XDY9_9CHLR|nr:glycosyltransferase family 39 protein [Ornatilinea apprima]KPL78431.1 hypothetical protein ADN00_06830 [Ornatilinea apprima]
MPWKRIFWLVLITALAAFTLAYTSPAFTHITDIDSAIFQYAGRGILQGQLPYRDLYDHKPPAIFYLDALGLALGGGSRWGIWTLEVLSLTAAGALCALYLRRFFGKVPTIIATAAFLLNLTFFHQGGNLTEEYALPFQFGALLCLAWWSSGRRPRLSAFALGACVAAASTFKQPLGALAVSIGLFILLETLEKRDMRRLLPAVLWAGLGFTAVWAGWFAFFAFSGALPEFWEAAFAYNFALSGISTVRRLQALGRALVTLFNTAPFFMLSLLAWLAALPFLLLNDQGLHKLVTARWLGWLFLLMGALSVYNGIFRRGLTPYPAEMFGARQVMEIILGAALLLLGAVWLRSHLPEKLSTRLHALREKSHTPLRLPLLVAAIDLPVQLVMISLSGNNFGHYFMAALPSLTVLCAFFFWSLLNLPHKRQAAVWAAVLALPVLLVGAGAGIQKDRVSEDRYTRLLAQYVQSVTRPDETIFYWGNLVPLYIESQRQSPSCFYFTDPLFLKGYTSRQHTAHFLRELQSAPPALIISSAGVERPLILRDDPADCASLADMQTVQALAAEQFHTTKFFIPEGMPEVYAWICANYTAEEVVLSEKDNWVKTFYHYTPERQARSQTDAP